MQNLVDSEARIKALDISKSFIIQAPAGSGKTHLLITRYLTALVDIKEDIDEVLAITFTNKAALEMRDRVINLLKSTAANHEKKDLSLQESLALKLLNIDKEKNLNILKQPEKLAIITIDALCQKIINSSHELETRLNSQNIATDPGELYEEAIQQMLSEYADKPWSNQTGIVLSYLNNNYTRLHELLVELLASRDIWLPYVINNNSKSESVTILENNLNERINSFLTHANNTIPQNMAATINKFLNLYLKKQNLKHVNITCNNTYQLDTWRQIATLILNKQNETRKTLNSKMGVSAPSSTKDKEEQKQLKQLKIEAKTFLEEIANEDDFIACLRYIRELPSPKYSIEQLEVLNPIMSLLPIAVAYLNIVFQEQQKCDFIAKSIQCNNILGSIESPTDECLNISQKLRHILVDEFQDTSLSQLKLIEKLIISWEEADKKTIFLVGDPMQSIYKFRQADVSIFTNLINNKIQNIKLNYLKLKTNFRSEETIVNWTNYVFSNLFCESKLPYTGNVPFNAATSHKKKPANKIECFLINEQDKKYQHTFIIERVKELQKNNITDIAILARSRGHVKGLISLLNKNNIQINAEEIEPLSRVAACLDLCSLSLALQDMNDTCSWLSLLYSPMCGISLKSIHKIAQFEKELSILERLSHPDLKLENDCAERINCFTKIINYILSKPNNENATLALEEAWKRLGGPKTIDNKTTLISIENLFVKLLDNGKLPNSWNKWQDILNNSYVTSSNGSEACVSIMTIHKSKGLEFQHVIIPSFSEATIVNKAKLLNWHLANNPKNNLILGAIPKHREFVSDIHNYLKYIDTLQTDNENKRLLYVAATRAKCSLDLVGFADLSDNNIKVKNNNSFLQKTWKIISKSELTKVNIVARKTSKPQERTIATRNILKLEYMKKSSSVYQDITKTNADKDMSGATDEQIFGEIIHACLEKIANLKTQLCSKIVGEVNSLIKVLLIEKNHNLKSLKENHEYLEKIMISCLQDKTLLWILSKNHSHAKNEYDIATIKDNKIMRYRIDRTFICKTGERWIIDYKTTNKPNIELSEFYKIQKKAHLKQLEDYAELFSHEKRNIVLAIYYPKFSGFFSWNYAKQK